MKVESWWGNIIPQHVVEYFDKCAESGYGPHQNDVTSIFYELTSVDVRNTEFEMDPETILWSFTRDRYGWVIPAGNALDEIAWITAGRRVIEIGCGSGYVSACLRARGVVVDAYNGPRSWRKWWKKKWLPDIRTAKASEIVYDTGNYIMLMPDNDSEGEDMMAEVARRIPVGSVLYMYAPLHCSGSMFGHATIREAFSKILDLDKLNMFPSEAVNDKIFAYKKVCEVPENITNI